MTGNDNSHIGSTWIRRFPVIHWLTDRFSNFVLRHKFAVAYLVLIISMVPLLPAVGQWSQGDMRLYQGVSGDLLAGKLPYRDRVLEYPPYAIPFFLLPRAFGGDDAYSTIFMLTILLGDWLMKLSLIVIGIRVSNTLRFLLPLLVYSLAVPAIHFFYLQRYDIWPALICVATIWAFCSRRYFLSGTMAAIGIGVKLYPAVFCPPLFILAVRQVKGQRFCAGLVAGLLPMVILSFFLPWWRFAEFQGARGLQVESLYASILWLAKLLHLTSLHWVFTKAWFEIKGSAVSAVLPWARVMFAAAVIGSMAFVSWVAARLHFSPQGKAGARASTISIPVIARLLLIPLLAFVAFNQVLSPQYIIWLLPLAALASLEGKMYVVFAIPLATLLTPQFFPTAEYSAGLNLAETVILLLRNLMLIATWALLLREMFGKAKTGGRFAVQNRPPL